MARYGEIWRDMAGYGGVWGDVGRHVEHVVLPEGVVLEHLAAKSTATPNPYP